MIPKDFVTIALRNAAERDVLALLLRTRSGFIVASRDADDPAAPRLGPLVIMPPAPPFVTAIAAPAYPRTPPTAQPVPFTSTSQQMLVPPDPRSTSPGSELPLEDF
jgi:hypothetical protein